MKTIILPKDVRVFERRGKSLQLLHTDRYFRAGASLTIGDPLMMVYDHRDQLAVGLENNAPFYLLVSEIGNLNAVR